MKKYIIKSLSICAIALLALTQTSCSDLLDQYPQGEWTETPEGSFQADIFSLYAKARGYGVTSGIPVLAIQGFRSEDAEKGSTSADGSADARMYDDFEYTATNGLIQKYWEDNYNMIHTANKVLTEMDEYITEKADSLSSSDLINKSEAHFFRAFGFFNLVRAFGEVPLINFKIEEGAEEGNIAKSSAEKIYEQIDFDLTEAEKYLPQRWEKKYIGRLTWGAARSLHARAYMMRNDWGNMHTAAVEVINSDIYDLKTPFNKIFREDGENSSESIFEIQCTSTESLPADNSIGSQYAQIQGVKGGGDWNLGWGWHTPTQELADAFEPNDPRKDETLLYFYKSETEAAAPSAIVNKPWGEKPIAGVDVINKYYNKKAYTDPSLRRKYSKDGFWVNIRIIRYADVLLMAAESANELGNTGEALKYLEEVRERARKDNPSALPKVTTEDQTELRGAIRHERRVELAMEYDRFYDLVRWGTATQVLHAAGKTKYQSKHALLPLPQLMVDQSNGVLKQNPNY